MTSPPPRPRALRRPTAVAEGGLLLLVASGTGLALWARDAAAPFPSVLFYATPLPLLALGAWTGAGLARLGGRRRRAALWVAGALALSLATARREWSPGGPRQAPADSLQVVSWNLQNGLAGQERLEQALLELSPDLICLGEVGSRGDAGRALVNDLDGFLRARGYVTRSWPEQRLLLGLRAAHGELLEQRWLRPAATCRLLLVGARWRGRDLRIGLTDFSSAPWLDRAPGAAALLQTLEADPGPWICLGDFNTPLASRCFDGWRAAGARQAGEEAGAGWLPTWPAPCPVLTLDHVWSRGLEVGWASAPLRAESDHCPSVAELGWP